MRTVGEFLLHVFRFEDFRFQMVLEDILDAGIYARCGSKAERHLPVEFPLWRLSFDAISRSYFPLAASVPSVIVDCSVKALLASEVFLGYFAGLP